MEWWQTIITLIATLGGFEFVKYLLNRKSNSRIINAQATKEEFHALREYNEFLQKQLYAKEERFAEQTALVRSQNSDIMKLTNEKAALDLELAKKRCERQRCPNREPQNGY